MRDINKEDHFNEFPNADPNSEKYKEICKIALEERRAEIELYWKRTTYYWAFIAAAFAAYALVFTKEKPTEQSYLMLAIISVCGIVFSIGWFLANRGSKYWQENWEDHVGLLITRAYGPIFKILKYPKGSSMFGIKAYPFSVSKINQITSGFMVVVWISLLLISLFTIGCTAPSSKVVISGNLISNNVVANPSSSLEQNVITNNNLTTNIGQEKDFQSSINNNIVMNPDSISDCNIITNNNLTANTSSITNTKVISNNIITNSDSHAGHNVITNNNVAVNSEYSNNSGCNAIIEFHLKVLIIIIIVIFITVSIIILLFCSRSSFYKDYLKDRTEEQKRSNSEPDFFYYKKINGNNN